MVQPLGVVEMDGHLGAEGFVAVGHHIEQVSHRDQIADRQILPMIHQQLHHHLQGRPFALQDARHGDQCLHQCWAERIHATKHLPIPFLGQQNVHDVVFHAHRLLERGVELLTCGGRLALQHPLLGDGGEVAIFECDRVEPALLKVERVAEIELLGTGYVWADEIAEISLSGHKANHRNRTIC